MFGLFRTRKRADAPAVSTAAVAAALPAIDRPHGTRAAAFAPSFGTRGYNPETREVEFVLATETPVRSYRGDYFSWFPVDEVLRMDGCENAAALNVPLLNSHWRYSLDSMIGRITSGRIEGGSLVCRAVVSDVPSTAEIRTKLSEGVIREFSVGFTILEEEVVPPVERGGVGTATITRWRVDEGSAVPVPADPNAVIRARHRLPADAALPTAQEAPVSQRTAAKPTKGDAAKLRSAVTDKLAKARSIEDVKAALETALSEVESLEEEDAAEETTEDTVAGAEGEDRGMGKKKREDEDAGERSKADAAAIKSLRSIASKRGLGADFDAFVGTGASLAEARSFLTSQSARGADTTSIVAPGASAAATTAGSEPATLRAFVPPSKRMAQARAKANA